jgi:hypothetical protein
LREFKDARGIQVYADRLAATHAHLLLAPGDSLAGLGPLMKALAHSVEGAFRNSVEKALHGLSLFSGALSALLAFAASQTG